MKKRNSKKKKKDKLEKDVEEEKKNIKALKQKSKDYNKRKKRKEQKKVQFVVPNIKEIPENCKKFVQDNDVIYEVPGDGACGPNTAAAHLFKDEVFGPKLRKNMNNFFADHYYDKYMMLSPCSIEEPFIRNCKGRNVSFTDPEKLIKFLKTSNDAQYMWSDGEDFVVISDMYQMRIKIITIKGLNDENPSVNWIYPDRDLKEYAEIKDAEIDDMVVLHKDDEHFDLIIDGNSDLAKMGSLSYRHNIGPIIKERKENNKLEEEEKTEIEILREKLKNCEKSRAELQKQYNECEEDLRKKTEELEKMKSLNKDFKEIMKLEQELIKQDIVLSDEESGEKSIISEPQSNINMQSPPFKYRPKFQNQEEEFNCQECDHQGTSQKGLVKHIQLKHTHQEIIKCSICSEMLTTNQNLRSHIEKSHIEYDINCSKWDNNTTTQYYAERHPETKHEISNHIDCRICGEKFQTKGKLMHHRKNMHPDSVAPCRNKMNGQCPYSDEKCWWRHVEKTGDNKTCYICGTIFANKNEIMIHRKKEHENIVPDCQEFDKNQCRFQNTFCWYKHTEKKHDEELMNSELDQVFQKASENMKPPIMGAQNRAVQ